MPSPDNTPALPVPASMREAELLKKNAALLAELSKVRSRNKELKEILDLVLVAGDRYRVTFYQSENK